MTAPIEDVGSLPGKKISDQAENPIGKVKEIFATDDGYPMWVAVELYGGIGEKRIAPMPRSSRAVQCGHAGRGPGRARDPRRRHPDRGRPGSVCAIRAARRCAR